MRGCGVLKDVNQNIGLNWPDRRTGRRTNDGPVCGAAGKEVGAVDAEGEAVDLMDWFSYADAGFEVF